MHYSLLRTQLWTVIATRRAINKFLTVRKFKGIF